MLVKLSMTAAVLAYAAVSLSAVHYGDLYNEMYPVNGLKRDVLGLCQAAKPTFIRALEQDRIDCYDSMPNAIERAIGWVRTSARLAAMRTPTGVELAEKLMQRADLGQRGAPVPVLHLAANPPLAGSGSANCDVATASPAAASDPALGESGDERAATERLARRLASGDKKLLAELGLTARDVRYDLNEPRALPVLSLGGSGGGGPAKGAATGLPGVGSAVAAAAPGCRNPA